MKFSQYKNALIIDEKATYSIPGLLEAAQEGANTVFTNIYVCLACGGTKARHTEASFDAPEVHDICMRRIVGWHKTLVWSGLLHFNFTYILTSYAQCNTNVCLFYLFVGLTHTHF
jgi:hypothetical protein